MKPGGVSTSGLLTLRDAQTMTTDCTPRLAGRRRGWPELDWVQRPGVMPRHGEPPSKSQPGLRPLRGRRPGASSPLHPVRCIGWRVRLMRGPLPGFWKIIGGRQGRDLWLFAPCPIRVQQGLPLARFRWSAPGGATPSGAVSAGSNPAGGTAQTHKFEHSDNLGPTGRQPCDLRQCSALPDLAPDMRPESRHQLGRGLFSRTRPQRPSGRYRDRRPLLFPVSAARQRQYWHRPGAGVQPARSP